MIVTPGTVQISAEAVLITDFTFQQPYEGDAGEEVAEWALKRITEELERYRNAKS